MLLILDLRQASEAAVEGALGLPEFEARQRVRRGGYQLLRSAEPGEAEQEARRLRGAGLQPMLIPEAEARALSQPRVVGGGQRLGAGLELRTPDGVQRLEPGAVLLVVKGPIVREYAPRPDVRRVRMATLEPGYRFHLHAHDAGPPLELDPGGFDFRGPREWESSLLQLSAWVEAVAAECELDDGFRQLPPALAPAAASQGVAAAAESLTAGSGRKDAPQVLDNLLQFRLYSGWRGALARRRAPS